MKTLLCIICVFFVCGLAHADSSMQYYDFGNGRTGTSINLGGNITYHDFGRVHGTSMDLGGGMVVHEFSDGTHGTSMDMGNGMVIHEFQGKPYHEPEEDRW